MDGPTISRTPFGRALLGVGVLITVAVIALTCLTAVSFGARHTERASSTFPLPTSTLTIDAPDAGVDITPGDGPGVMVDRTITTGLRRAQPVWRMEGSTLTLRSGCPTVLVTGCESRYHIRIPATTALEIRNADGSVRIHDILGQLDVNSSDGSVYVEGATGDLRVRSSDGSVRAERLTSPHVSVRGSDGSVRLAFARPPDQVETWAADGSIRILLPRDPAGYSVARTAANGSVGGDVANVPGARRVVDAHADGGSIDVSYGGPLN